MCHLEIGPAYDVSASLAPLANPDHRPIPIKGLVTHGCSLRKQGSVSLDWNQGYKYIGFIAIGSPGGGEDMALNFDLTEEQNLTRQAVRDFAEKEIAPLARELDEREEFSVELTQKMGRLGLLGCFIPEKYGGSHMGYISYIIAVEELARVDGSQAATIAAGNSRTRAELRGDTWVIHGSKIFITNSANPLTGCVIVQAITGVGEGGKRELSSIIVPRGAAGFTAKKMKGKMMWRASNTGELFFEECTVPGENLLGARGDGLRQMLATLDSGRLSIAAMGLGGAQGAFEITLQYANTRIQFGRPISSFQVNAFKLADMALEIELARNLLYKACWLRENQRPFSKEAAMAKLYSSEVMGRVVDQAVQLHGAYGLIKDYEIERFYRDQKILEIGEGTSEIQRIIIARNIGVAGRAV
jgi:short/branched chain acyl-CoA dehydrogenase